MKPDFFFERRSRKEYKPCDLREFGPEGTPFGFCLVIGCCVASFITKTAALLHGVGVVPATVKCDPFRKTLHLFGAAGLQYFGQQRGKFCIWEY